MQGQIWSRNDEVVFVKKSKETKKEHAMNLSEEELLALYRVLKSNEESYSDNAEEVYDDYYDEYREPIRKSVINKILKKITLFLPEKEINEVNKYFLRRKYHTFNNAVDQVVYATLKKGLAQLQTVAIEYFDMDSAEFIKREIDVYHTTARYTEAYCHLRKANRTFRTSRIAKARLTSKKYHLPA